MKFIAVFLLALVAVGNCGSVRNRATRSVSQETLDMVFDAFVYTYRTVVENYPADLVQEVVHEVLENDGAFNFSPELRAKLDDKRVELSAKLKVVMVEIAANGEELPDEVTDKLHEYFDYSVDYMLSLTPFELMEEITKEVLANGGAFDFSPKVLSMLEDTKATFKDGSKKLLDYEFEVFADLIELDDEFRQKIYTAMDYMVDRFFDAIPWDLLEDTVYFVLSNDGSIDLSDELWERIETTKDDLREQLREALDYVDELLGGGMKRVMLK
ncbi:hypothetical protein RP20_CCG014411 [Aedes albopictus]|nr:hypothetical protein RP20_CCG017270 [Aedes albopictus]KXJ74070.1 hypothetical protein RP20_CCG014411 [Aedes albopictus]